MTDAEAPIKKPEPTTFTKYGNELYAIRKKIAPKIPPETYNPTNCRALK